MRGKETREESMAGAEDADGSLESPVMAASSWLRHCKNGTVAGAAAAEEEAACGSPRAFRRRGEDAGAAPSDDGDDCHEACRPASAYNPVPGVASLSLAMGSIFAPKVIAAAAPPSSSSRPSSMASSSSSPLAPSSPSSSSTSAKMVWLPKPSRVDTSARRALNPGRDMVGSSNVEFATRGAAMPTYSSGRAAAAVAAGSFTSPMLDLEKVRDGMFWEPQNPVGMRRVSIVWFRNDLRVHDNEALVNASNESLSIVPVYCFDPRDYGKSSSGFDKTGPYRAKFLLECVATLRENLRERGSELVVRIGKPEDVLVDLAKKVGADALYAHLEVSQEEMNAEARVDAALKAESVESKFFWGSTLFHIDDLPFKLDEMPSNYGGFRDRVQQVEVRSTLPAPDLLKPLPIRGSVKVGDIPTLQDLGLNPVSVKQPEKRSADGPSVLVGGEQEALQRLRSFSKESCDMLKGKSDTATTTVDSIYGANFSCKISPWLAMGCLSPRRMFEDLRQSTKRGAAAPTAPSAVAGVEGDGLNWLVFELLWRDFFRFITKKFGDGKRSSHGAPATAGTGSYAIA